MLSDNLLANAIHRVKRIVNSRIIKRWGDARTKQEIWDQEFQAGAWTYLDSTADDLVYGFIERYAKGGRILDLGCGAGNTGNELDPHSYAKYIGVDVSRVATDFATARSAQNDRAETNRYFCGDIANFVPPSHFEVILFRESIFYIPHRKIGRTLSRYRSYLADDGVFIVRMCSKSKYKSIIRLIQNDFRVMETSSASEPSIVLVFR